MKKILFLALLMPSLLLGTYNFKGTHFLASYSECVRSALLDTNALRYELREAIETAGATILSVQQHDFPDGGVTIVFLLSESHASIHTYPECDSCFVDFFYCGDNADYRAFRVVLENYLFPKNMDVQVINR